MIKKFLKTKKIFLLSLVPSALFFVGIYIKYKVNPFLCSENLKTTVKCSSFLDYLLSLGGIFSIFLMIFIFLLSLVGLTSVFLFLNKRKKLGYLFLIIFLLIFISIVFLSIL